MNHKKPRVSIDHTGGVYQMPVEQTPLEDRAYLRRMQAVVGCITDQQILTWGNLTEMAHYFCAGQYSRIVEKAEQTGLDMNALTVVALLMVDHPLLVKPCGGWIYSPGHAFEVVQQAMAMPVDNLWITSQKPVDNLLVSC